MTTEESFFLTSVIKIAKKHGCTIDNIDIENKKISLGGGNECNEYNCIAEIISMFESYLV